MENYKLNKNELDKLKLLCTPIAEWLQTERDSMETVIITAEHFKLVADEMGGAFKLPEGY